MRRHRSERAFSGWPADLQRAGLLDHAAAIRRVAWYSKFPNERATESIGLAKPDVDVWYKPE